MATLQHVFFVSGSFFSKPGTSFRLVNLVFCKGSLNEEVSGAGSCATLISHLLHRSEQPHSRLLCVGPCVLDLPPPHKLRPPRRGANGNGGEDGMRRAQLGKGGRRSRPLLTPDRFLFAGWEPLHKRWSDNPSTKSWTWSLPSSQHIKAGLRGSQLHLAVAQTTGKIQNGLPWEVETWLPKPAVCPSDRLILSHTHLEKRFHCLLPFCLHGSREGWSRKVASGGRWARIILKIGSRTPRNELSPFCWAPIP